MTEARPFWKTKSLAEMTEAEWESLCDGCGRCCLHKLRYESPRSDGAGDRKGGAGDLAFTNVACHLLDLTTCQCRKYPTRRDFVPDCVTLTPTDLAEIDWLPPSCAYRRLEEGKDLAWWHPLVSGNADTVHQAGISVAGRAVDERYAGPLEHHIVDWPGRMPRVRQPRKPKPSPDPTEETE